MKKLFSLISLSPALVLAHEGHGMPGRVVQQWQIAKTTGRRIESPEVAALSVEITDQLRKEIRRNAA